MKRTRLIFSVFIAVSVVCAAALLTRFTMFALLLLFPGGFALAFLKIDQQTLSPNPILLIVANVVCYTPIIFLCLLVGRNGKPESKMRRLAAFSGVAALVLAVLALVPAVNPLWPHGMQALRHLETDLRTSLPTGVNIDTASSVLRTRGIPFSMRTESARNQVMSNGSRVIWADAGDRVMFSRWPTEASEYSCGYDMQIILVFGADGIAKENYISRFPMCP